MIFPVAMDNSLEHSSSDNEGPSRHDKPLLQSSKPSSPGSQSRTSSWKFLYDSTSSQGLVSEMPPVPSSTVTLSNPTPYEQFWFHDGSIILHVEDKLFRVHQTILANHSEVFKGLFQVPQPPDADTLEGCHIVHLHDVVADFIDLLNAVYDPSYFDAIHTTADVETILNFISGILRLSTKYLIRSLRQRCIPLFTAKFPSTFQNYLAKSSSPSTERYKSESVMRAVILAHETNVVEVLPYAYYCVARMSMRRVMKERQGDLEWKEKCLCLVGRERLRWAEMSVSHSFLLVFNRAPSCQSHLCAHTRGPHSEWHILEASKSPNPLRGYTRWSHLNACKDCVDHCQAVHLKGRREVWERLPSFFDLPTWEKLKETQNL